MVVRGSWTIAWISANHVVSGSFEFAMTVPARMLN